MLQSSQQSEKAKRMLKTEKHPKKSCARSTCRLDCLLRNSASVCCNLDDMGVDAGDCKPDGKKVTSRRQRR